MYDLTRNDLDELHSSLLNMMKTLDDFCRTKNISYFMLGGTALGAIRHQGFIPWDDDMDIGMPQDDYKKFLDSTINGIGDEYIVRNYENDKTCPYAFTRLEDKRTTYLELDRDNEHYIGGAYIDIFPLVGASNSYFKRRLQEIHLLLWKKILFAKVASPASKKRPFYKKAFMMFARHTFSVGFIIKKIHKIIFHYPYNGSNYASNILGHWGLKEVIPKTDFLPPKEYIFEGQKFWGPQNATNYLNSLYGKDYMTPPPEELRKGHHYAHYFNLNLPYEQYNPDIHKQKI
ncbi:LicD family protein [Clostridium sp. AN503]|uniref:LicD family protein n=1 Tax=Clostridium sp. AN503 TaxID=3160598 RepID=UPI00345B36F4